MSSCENSNEADFLRRILVNISDVPIGSCWQKKVTDSAGNSYYWRVAYDHEELKWERVEGNRSHKVTDGLMVIACPVKMSFNSERVYPGLVALADGEAYVWVMVDHLLRDFRHIDFHSSSASSEKDERSREKENTE